RGGEGWPWAIPERAREPRPGPARTERDIRREVEAGPRNPTSGATPDPYLKADGTAIMMGNRQPDDRPIFVLPGRHPADGEAASIMRIPRILRSLLPACVLSLIWAGATC